MGLYQFYVNNKKVLNKMMFANFVFLIPAILAFVLYWDVFPIIAGLPLAGWFVITGIGYVAVYSQEEAKQK